MLSPLNAPLNIYIYTHTSVCVFGFNLIVSRKCIHHWISSITYTTVPACQNLYKNSFTYQCLQDEKTLQFDDANHFLGLYLLLLIHFHIYFFPFSLYDSEFVEQCSLGLL
ncbi:hypothetical protein PanWU01x14_335600 [Parasponia andersonii]|uniref:Uncharacterized protein n=1 Tax=Parasponia andersonii TaxID=3476 RepID=A0A2P5AG69_PARAD|nr:hypothetical protein PanWU01x14_335600 [Parasponia andersonii]